MRERDKGTKGARGREWDIERERDNGTKGERERETGGRGGTQRDRWTERETGGLTMRGGV